MYNLNLLLYLLHKLKKVFSNRIVYDVIKFDVLW